jgi:hypothetical protein
MDLCLSSFQHSLFGDICDLEFSFEQVVTSHRVVISHKVPH